jgi:hypothetical protein
MDPFEPVDNKSEEDQARIRAQIMQMWFKPNNCLTTA